ncbi:MAG: hypothetical protein NVSMB44_21020 [Ktedonobacteraceae bacterium]
MYSSALGKLFFYAAQPLVNQGVKQHGQYRDSYEWEYCVHSEEENVTEEDR